MTLDRVLSRWGIASRTVAAEMIRAGRVSVAGRTVTDPEVWVDPQRQPVQLDGKPLHPPRKIYIALHKPKGYLTSHGDPQGRPTIYDLLSQSHQQAPVVLGGQTSQQLKTRQRRRLLGDATREARWLFPVGRLDQETTGLLLMTNDSVFAEQIANPLTKVAKTYRVKVNALVTEAELQRLREGVDLGRDERSGPAQVAHLRDDGDCCWLEVVIHEGKNRQVRRMMEALGHAVLELTRVRIGKLELGNLPSGAWREVRPEQVTGVAVPRTSAKAVQPPESKPKPGFPGTGKPASQRPKTGRSAPGRKPRRAGTKRRVRE